MRWKVVINPYTVIQTIVYCVLDGVEAPPVLNICLSYQKHLSEVACVIANAQVRRNDTCTTYVPYSNWLIRNMMVILIWRILIWWDPSDFIEQIMSFFTTYAGDPQHKAMCMFCGA